MSERAVGDHLSALLELGRLLNSSLQLDEVLSRAVEHVVQFIQAERGFIVLADSETHRVTGRAVQGVEPDELEDALSGRANAREVSISRSIVVDALHNCRPVVATNAMDDPRFEQNASVRMANLRSVLCVPLLFEGVALGVVYVDSRLQEACFDANDAALLLAFAEHAAVAIRNAGLYAELAQSIEHRVRLERELHEAEGRRTALEEANRLKSDYVGYVSHELRNPLTVVRGFVQTLARAEPGEIDSATVAEYLETIEAEADRMLDLINELLDSARIEAGRPISLNTRRTDPRPAIERTTRRLRFSRFWTTAHSLELQIADDLPHIVADEDKLVQILANLLSNAVKYSPTGGPIAVAAAPTETGILISVTDSGIGLAPDERTRIFSRFERAERAALQNIPGTGLGLYLTRYLAELHGGSVDCASAPGEGSTFTLYLPSGV